MACSSASTATTSKEEKREQRLIDAMFLCDEWKSSKGGLSTFNRELAINLAEKTTGSLNIHCYVSRSDDQDREEAEQHGVNLITAQTVPGSRDILDWLKVPPPELPNPHIVIGHGRKLGTPACLIARGTGCKWIQFVHVFCEDLGKFKESTATAVTDTIEENEERHKMEIELCKAADAVVAVGSRLQQKYSRSLPNVKVEIITPGIVEKFCNESVESREHAGILLRTWNAFKSYMFMKTFNVFMFGRATFEDLTLKGYDIVANAIGSLGEKFELTFVGSSPGEHRNVEQWFLQKTCIKRKQITIRGYCTEQDELKEMFHQSDLVALPSRTEGFGLVGLEAISCGVPILVSGESGIAEALQNVKGGNTVIVGSDEVEWAWRISKVSSQSPEERQANARQLRENYREVYSWKAECERFHRLIENVVKTANGSEMNIKVDVKYLKPKEQNVQTGMLATESVRCQEVQQPRASATSAASGSVSHLQTEDIHALREKTFLSIIRDSFYNTNPKSIEECNWFMEYTKKMKLTITGVEDGSLIIKVKCESLMILEELWTDYSSSHLGEVVQNCFVTEKILKELNLAELRLKTTMDIEEYYACKMFFEKDALRGAISSEFHSASSTSESQQKKEQWEKSELKTKIMEKVKLEGMLPLPGSSTFDSDEELVEPCLKRQRMEGASPSEFHTIGSTSESPQIQEELKKWKQKTKIVETEKLRGSSSPLLLPSTNLEEKLGRVCEDLKILRLEGGFPVLQFSTVDLEKKLAKVRIEHQRLRIEGTLPPPELFTADLEDEIKGLRNELTRLRMKGSSHPLVSTIEVELDGLLKQLSKWRKEVELEEQLKKLQKTRMEGSFPVLLFSTIDLEEKLEELCMESQRLRMKGTLPPPVPLTADLVEKLKGLLTELERQRDKGSLPHTSYTIEVELEELLKKLQKTRMEGMLPLPGSSIFDLEEKLRKLHMDLEMMEGSLHSLPTTDLKEKLEQVFEETEMLRMRIGSFSVLNLSTIDLEKKLVELIMKLQRLRMEGTLPPPELFTADLEDELKQLEHPTRRKREKGSSHSVFPTVDTVLSLRRELKKVEMEALENAMYPTIRSGLAKFDVSLPVELQNYVSYLLNESAKLHFRKQVLQPPRALEELREAMDEDELKTFLTIHIREGAWQVVLLFTDELPRVKLPWDWYDIIYNEDEDKEELSRVIYSSTSGILNVWPTEYDPGLVTLCKAITNRDWKVTRLIRSRSRISDEGLKNLSTALPQSELYSLTLHGKDLQSQGLKYLCEALISSDCHLTSLNVSDNKFGDEGIMHLCNALTSVNCTLTSLNVSDNKFGDEGIMHLCNALTSVNCRLTSLNASHIQWGDNGFKHLCDALTSSNCVLTKLKIVDIRLGDGGIKELSGALTNGFCTLTSLDISNNKFGDKGIKHLCKALTDTNCKLRSLDYYGNWNVTDKGRKYLSQMLTGTDWEDRITRLSRSTTK